MAIGDGALLWNEPFTYSDGALSSVASGLWTNGYWSGQASLVIASNELVDTGGSWNDNYSLNSYGITNGLELVLYDIYNDSGPSGSWAYAHICGSPAASPSGYWVRWQNGLAPYVGKLTSGSFSNIIVGSTALTVNRTNTVDLCVQIQSNGNMELFHRINGGSWVSQGTGSDTSYTSGRIGFEFLGAINCACTGFELRDLTVPSGVAAGSLASAFTGTTVAPTIPAHVAGDKLIVVAAKNDGATLSASAGWSAIGTPENNANLSTGAWEKTAASASETVTITSSTEASSSAGLYARAFVGKAPDYDTIVDPTWNGSPTSSTTPGSALVTATDAAIALAIAAIDDPAAFSSGLPPSLWSNVANDSASASSEQTTIIRPNGTQSNNWTLSGAASAHVALQDVVTQPTAPTVPGGNVNSQSTGQVCDVQLADYTPSGTVTSVTAWFYCAGGSKKGLRIALRDATGELAGQDIAAGTGAGWQSVTYNGAPTINNLRLVMTTGSGGGGGQTSAFVYAAYAVVTETLTGAGARFTSIKRDIASSGDVAAVTIGTLPSAKYWKSLTLLLQATSGGDTTPPIPNIITGPSRTKISSVVGFDSTDIEVQVNEACQAWKAKVVPATDSVHTAGTQVEAGGSVAGGGTINVNITDDELSAASPGDGAKIVKFFFQDNAGNWSV